MEESQSSVIARNPMGPPLGPLDMAERVWTRCNSSFYNSISDNVPASSDQIIVAPPGIWYVSRLAFDRRNDIFYVHNLCFLSQTEIEQCNTRHGCCPLQNILSSSFPVHYSNNIASHAFV